MSTAMIAAFTQEELDRMTFAQKYALGLVEPEPEHERAPQGEQPHIIDLGGEYTNPIEDMVVEGQQWDVIGLNVKHQTVGKYSIFLVDNTVITSRISKTGNPYVASTLWTGTSPGKKSQLCVIAPLPKRLQNKS